MSLVKLGIFRDVEYGIGIFCVGLVPSIVWVGSGPII
jgi:hypothetical protein